MNKRFYQLFTCAIILFSFYAMVIAQPSVVQVWPQPNRIDVPGDTLISVVFSESMDVSSLTNNNILAYGSYTGFNSSNHITYNSSEMKLTYNPDDDFLSGELITFIITSNVRSMGGAYLDKTYFFRFYIKTQYGSGVFKGHLCNTSGNPGTITSCDINNDHNIDLATETAIMMNDGKGLFSSTSSLSWGGTVESADLDHDGDIDLAMTFGSGDQIKIFKNDGNGNYTESGTPYVGDNPVDLEIADYNGDSHLDLAVVLRGMNAIGILNNNGSGGFSSPTLISVGFDPRSLVCGDFDSDYDLDLAVTNDGDNSISILLNNGSAAFSESQLSGIGSSAWPRSITCGDYDNDGDLDLAVSNDSENSVTLLINDGNANFTAAQSPSVGTSPFSIISLDIEGDGDLDLCVANNNSNFMSLLWNDGSGNFSTDSIDNLGRYAVSLESADYNNDGYIDLAAVNTDLNRISVLHNRPYYADISVSNDSLKFARVKIDSVKSLPLILYNNSGISNLQITNISFSSSSFTTDIQSAVIAPADSLQIMVRFSPQTMADYQEQLTIYSNDPADPQYTIRLFGQGNPVAVHTPGANALGAGIHTNISVTFGVDILPTTLNNGTIRIVGSLSGLHSAGIIYDSGSRTVTLDPDKDFLIGELVTVILTKEIEILNGTPFIFSYQWQFYCKVLHGSARFKQTSKISPIYEPRYIMNGDFNGDGNLDFIVRTTHNVQTVYLNKGNNDFEKHSEVWFDGGISTNCCGDFENDGDLDIIVNRLVAPDFSVQIARNNGDATFSSPEFFETFDIGRHSLAVLDINGDGYLDLTHVNEGNGISVLKNNENGVLTQSRLLMDDERKRKIITGDLNGDGDIDIFVIDQAWIDVLLNFNGVLTRISKIDCGGVQDAVTGDFNQDGKVDLIVAYDPGLVKLYYNDGNTSFASDTQYQFQRGIYSICANDFDADNDLDLFVITEDRMRRHSYIWQLLNDGTGNFSQNEIINFNTYSPTMACGDFDSDGDIDLFITDADSNSVRILENENEQADIVLSDESHDFGQVSTDGSSRWSFSIGNDGGIDTLHISNITLSNGCFSADITSGTIAVGEELVVTVEFAPQNVQFYSDTITIYSDDFDEPQLTINVTGQGQPIVINSSPQSNSINIEENNNIDITCNGTMLESSVNAGTFIVSGNIGGRYSGSYSVTDSTISFQADRNFCFGEEIQVTLTPEIQSTQGYSLGRGYSFKFITKINFGRAHYVIDTTYNTVANAARVVPGDFDEDQLTDLAILNDSDDNITFYTNNGQSALNDPQSFDTDSYLHNYAPVDFDQDGDLDFLTLHHTLYTIDIWRNDGMLTFSNIGSFNTGSTAGPCATGDLNNDGYPDVVIANQAGNHLSVLFSMNGTSFQEPLGLASGSNPSDVILYDLDHNGFLDVINTNTGSDNITCCLNSDDGFSDAYIYMTGTEPVSIIGADIDLDGDIDLISANESGHSISVLFNDGEGILTPTTDLSVGTALRSLYSNDLDADGDMDLVAGSAESNNLYLFINNAEGHFSLVDSINIDCQVRDISGLDLSGRFGILDLVVVGNSPDQLIILRNQISNTVFVDVKVPSGEEQSGDITINYNIYNPDRGNVGLNCQYSVTDGVSWLPATVSGDTSQLSVDHYFGDLIWHSADDLPGVEDDHIFFKITPYQNQNGLADSVIVHLDNNQPPSVQLDTTSQELQQTITLNATFSDAEDDTLSIHCVFWQEGESQSYVPSIISDKDNILSNTNTTIIWDSQQDIPDYSGYLWFRVQPFDHDPGRADSVRLLVDNVGVPVIEILSQPADEQSGDIDFSYRIRDDEADLVDLSCFYSTDSSSWIAATTMGELSNISPQNYQGTITWLSETDLAGMDIEQTWFKILPADAHSGVARSTSAFHVDNNLPPQVSQPVYDSPLSGMVRIAFQLQDAEADELTLNAAHRKGENHWTDVLETVKTADQYQDTILWNTYDDLGYGEHSQMQIRLIPIDHDTGSSSISNTFSILNYVGDYSGDMHIDYDDLITFAQAWYEQDLSKEIGPASGQPPLLIPQPDGKIDFEDLMVLVQQWNWSYDHSGMNQIKTHPGQASHSTDISTADLLKRIEKEKATSEYYWQKNSIDEKSMAAIPDRNKALFSLMQSEYDPWNNKFGNQLFFSLDSTVALLGFTLQLEHEGDKNLIRETDNLLLSDQGGFTFIATDPDKSNMLVNSIVLQRKIKALDWSDGLISLSIESGKEKEIELSYRWTVHDIHKQVVSSGRAETAINLYSQRPETYALHQNFPNPFNPLTTIRYQLPVGGKVKLDIYNILGQRVARLAEAKQEAGFHSQNWDITQSEQLLASGLYIIHLVVYGEDGSRFIHSKKALLLK